MRAGPGLNNNNNINEFMNQKCIFRKKTIKRIEIVLFFDTLTFRLFL